MLPRVGRAEVSPGGDRPRGHAGGTAGPSREGRRFRGSGPRASCVATGPRGCHVPGGPFLNPALSGPPLQPRGGGPRTRTQEEVGPVPAGVEPGEGRPGVATGSESRVIPFVTQPRLRLVPPVPPSAAAANERAPGPAAPDARPAAGTLPCPCPGVALQPPARVASAPPSSLRAGPAEPPASPRDTALCSTPGGDSLSVAVSVRPVLLVVRDKPSSARPRVWRGRFRARRLGDQKPAGRAASGASGPGSGPPRLPAPGSSDSPLTPADLVARGSWCPDSGRGAGRLP